MDKTREALDWCDAELDRFIVGKREAADNVVRALREHGAVSDYCKD